MSAPLRTPLKTATGLGSAKDGTSHFVKQRVTAIALVFIVPWFLWSLVAHYRGGYQTGLDWLSQTHNAIAMLLLVSAAFYHMRLGLQVVIEDYISRHGTRALLLLLNTFVAAALWAAAVFSILKVAFAA